MTALGSHDADTRLLEARHAAHNYAPLDVVLARGNGAWVEDVHGVRYLDLLAAYSALNFGHRHPRLVRVAHEQLDRLTLTSRAFSNDQMGAFCRDLAALCGKDAVMPMNTGAEAVETAIKAARRWGYEVKGVPLDEAEIVVFDGNFHGRTTTIVGFSSDAGARAGFGPFTPGFRRVPFGDAAAVRAAIGDRTVAVLVEPIQGEAGVVVPPDGFLRALRRTCTDARVLLVADEIQSGLGRTGRTFACDHEDVEPDLYVLGKALGGGIVPLSAVVGDWDVLGVFTPGSHGSTFGGNPLACAVGREVVAMLATGEYQARAARLGARLHAALTELRDVDVGVTAVRGRGLWAGIELGASLPPPRAVCEAMLAERILVKDAHSTVRIAPPLVIDEHDLDWAVDRLAHVLRSRRAA
jgi:ornithine--oxo-acid transaminase